LYSSPKGEFANQIAQISADLLGLFGLSTIECRGRHENEQPNVGPKGERIGFLLGERYSSERKE